MRVSKGAGMSSALRLIYCLVIFATNSGALLAQKPVPELWGLQVHDEAKVLSHKQLTCWKTVFVRMRIQPQIK
jgi:hypothetical protein